MRPTTKVALGLFGSWVIHDLEELATMSATSRKVLARLPAWVPVPPGTAPGRPAPGAG